MKKLLLLALLIGVLTVSAKTADNIAILESSLPLRTNDYTVMHATYNAGTNTVTLDYNCTPQYMDIIVAKEPVSLMSSAIGYIVKSSLDVDPFNLKLNFTNTATNEVRTWEFTEDEVDGILKLAEEFVNSEMSEEVMAEVLTGSQVEYDPNGMFYITSPEYERDKKRLYTKWTITDPTLAQAFKMVDEEDLKAILRDGLSSQMSPFATILRNNKISMVVDIYSDDTSIRTLVLTPKYLFGN